MEFAFAAPHWWRASSAGGLLWLQRADGFYFDFDAQRGPYFVPSDGPGIVYRNPVPELFALQSLEACRHWMARYEPATTSPVSYGGRSAFGHEIGAAGGMMCRVVTDAQTGTVLHVGHEGPRGRGEVAVPGLTVVYGEVNADEFSWHGPVREYDGGHVRVIG